MLPVHGGVQIVYQVLVTVFPGAQPQLGLHLCLPDILIDGRELIYGIGRHLDGVCGVLGIYERQQRFGMTSQVPLSDGRLVMGVSPGGLVSDFEMFGVTDLQVRREMASECIDTVLKLWSTHPPYDISGKYWNIRLDEHFYPDLGVGELVKPYQQPHPPLVASAMSPNSGSVHTAAIKGWGVISANFVPAATIKTHWDGFSASCKEVGRIPEPADWRVARTIFGAPDDGAAKDYAVSPDGPFAHYYGYLVDLIKRAQFHAIMKASPDMPDDAVTAEYACENFIIAGSPDSVAEQILALREEIGPFGTILMPAAALQGAAHKPKLMASMELMAGEVMPKLRAALGSETAA